MLRSNSLVLCAVAETAASCWLEAFAFDTLTLKLARTANGFRLFTGLTLRGLFISLAQLHFAENAFALHLLLQRLQGLVDVIVADYDLNQGRLHRAGV